MHYDRVALSGNTEDDGADSGGRDAVVAARDAGQSLCSSRWVGGRRRCHLRAGEVTSVQAVTKALSTEAVRYIRYIRFCLCPYIFRQGKMRCRHSRRRAWWRTTYKYHSVSRTAFLSFPPLHPSYSHHTTMSESAMESVRALNKYVPIITDLLCLAGVVDASRLVLRVSPIRHLLVIRCGAKGLANSTRVYEDQDQDQVLLLIPPFGPVAMDRLGVAPRPDILGRRQACPTRAGDPANGIGMATPYLQSQDGEFPRVLGLLPRCRGVHSLWSAPTRDGGGARCVLGSRRDLAYHQRAGQG